MRPIPVALLLPAELTPEEYNQRLYALEQRWADEISAHVAKVANAIAPLPVRGGWIASLRDETHFLTIAHNARVESLDVEFYGPLLAELPEDDRCTL